jgi:predicted DNA-binding transcriptional regulator YafY
MAVTKYNIRRLKRLLAMLKENRYPNYPRFLAEMKRQDLAGAYDLSARTLQRDVAFLKHEYGAPIEYDRERRGYYLADPDWSADIPLLDDPEMRAAVLGARLAENLMPAPVKQEIRSAVDTLLSVNDKGLDENATLLSLVALGSRAKVAPAVFRIVFDAWQKRRCVKLTYETVDGHVSKRLAEPQALAFYEGNWYVKAVSRTKDGNSVPPEKRRASALALHRVKSAEETAVPFEPKQEIVDAVNRREIFDFPLVEDIRLRLGPEARKFIGEEFDVTDEGRDGDHYLVRIAAAPAYRIVNYVLVEGGDASLLNHPELAAEVVKRAKAAIAAQKKR